MPSTAPATASSRCTQFLDADAQLRAPLPAFARETAALLQLYRRMVETRIFDKTALALQRDGRFDGYTAFLGQEAVVAAVASSLRADDLLIGADRGYTLQQLHGASLLDVLRHWHAAQARSAASARQQFAHALEIASTLRHDAGARIALAPGDDRLSDNGRADAGPPLAHDVPLVIIVPRLRDATAAAGLEPPLRVPASASERVDGNDVIAMRDALQRAVTHARSGRGPRWIEALICPLIDSRADAASAPTRSPAEVRAAWELCPIKRLKRFLESRQLWTIEDEEALLLSAGEQANAAAQSLRSSRARVSG